MPMPMQTQARVWVLIVLAAGASVAPPQPQETRGGVPEGPFTGDIRRVGGAASVAGHPGMMVRCVWGGMLSCILQTGLPALFLQPPRPPSVPPCRHCVP